MKHNVRKMVALTMATMMSMQGVSAFGNEMTHKLGTPQISNTENMSVMSMSADENISVTSEKVLGLDAYLSQRQIADIYKDKNINDAQTNEFTDKTSANNFSVDTTESDTLRDDTLTNSLNVMNYIRSIAGVPSVTLNTTYNTYAQATAYVLSKIGDITHDIANDYGTASEIGVSDAVYANALKGQNSNLAAGTSSLKETLVNSWMADSDEYNIAKIGHRRNTLNPHKSDTGFGFAYNKDSKLEGESYAYKYYATNYVNGTSISDKYTSGAVVWPAQNMPVDMFDKNDAWKDKYAWSYSTYETGVITSENKANIQVELTKNNEAPVIFKTPSSTYKEGEDYFNVDFSVSSNYGDDKGCIVFRDDDLTYKAGDVFTVKITDNTNSETPVIIDEYEVNFFDIASPNLADKPVFTVDLSEKDDKKVGVGSTETVTIEATPRDFNDTTDTLTYQWYKASTDTAVTGGTSATFNIPTETVGTESYYCIVTNTVGSDKSTAISGTVEIDVVEVEAPTFDTDITANYTKEYTHGDKEAGETVDKLTVSASVKDGGTVSYEWYKVNADGEDTKLTTEDGVDEINSYEFTPPTDVVGEFTYYCMAINTSATGATNNKKSNEATITIKAFEVAEPTVATLVNATYEQGDSPSVNSVTITPLNGTATVTDSGTITYQWYLVGGEEDGSDKKLTITDGVDETDNSKFTPSTDDSGEFKYYCIATNTLTRGTTDITGTAETKSTTATITITEITADRPKFTTNLTSGTVTYLQGDTVADDGTENQVEPLEVLAELEDGNTNKGVISYQWYKVGATGDGSDDEAITDETNVTFTPPTDEAGEFEYYCKAVSTYEKGTASVTAELDSAKVTIVVTELTAETPSITTDLSEEVVVYPIGAPSDDNTTTVYDLEVTASVTNGDLTYQWYKVVENDDDTEVGTDLATFTPPTDTKGISKYYCVITNKVTNGDSTDTETKTSKTATISIKIAEAKAPNITTDLDTATKTIAQDSADTTLSIDTDLMAVEDGVLTYQWYKVIDGADDEVITDATADTFAPPTAEIGTEQYYCIVTNTDENAIQTTTTATSATATIEVKLGQAVAPVITTDLSTTPINFNIDTDEASAFVGGLEIVAKIPNSADGVLSYQWYLNGEAIIDATSATYTVVAPTIAGEGNVNLGIKNYYCEITNTDDKAIEKTNTITSATAKFSFESDTFKNAEMPIITTDLSTDIVQYIKGETATDLTVVANSSDEGTLTYQWYLNGEVIGGATNATYTPLTTIDYLGESEYHCVITNTKDNATGEKVNTTSTSTATIKVIAIENAEAPVITTNLSTSAVSYVKNASASALKVEANVSDGGIVTYQWFKDGVEISGATAMTYTPATSTVGTSEYYCVVTNTNNLADDNKIVTTTSAKATVVVSEVVVEVVSAVRPTITTNLSVVTSTYTQNATATPLVIEATASDGGTLTYQWVKDNLEIEGATSNTYTPSTSTVGTQQYYCVVTNTNNSVNGTKTAFTLSNLAKISVSSVSSGGSSSGGSSSGGSSSGGSSSGGSSSGGSGGSSSNDDYYDNSNSSSSNSSSSNSSSSNNYNNTSGDGNYSSGTGSSSSNTTTTAPTTVVNKPIVTPAVKVDIANTETKVDDATGNTVTTITFGNGAEVVKETTPDGNVTAEVTGITEKTALSIPLEVAPSPTQVVVIVKADGTREIIKDSIIDGDGFRITLDADAKIEVIDNAKDFGDIKAGSWYEDSVKFATSRELFFGMADGVFAPEGTMTRAMIWSVLYQYQGDGSSSGGSDWFSDAQAWSIKFGVSDGQNPNDNMTREQLVTILYRLGGDKSTTGNVEKFGDSTNVSDWASEAMNWAVAEGIIAGSGGNLNPKSSATRAEVAAIMMRFMEK